MIRFKHLYRPITHPLRCLSADMAFCFCQAICARNRITYMWKSSVTFTRRYYIFQLALWSMRERIVFLLYIIQLFNDTNINNYFWYLFYNDCQINCHCNIFSTIRIIYRYEYNHSLFIATTRIISQHNISSWINNMNY